MASMLQIDKTAPLAGNDPAKNFCETKSLFQQSSFYSLLATRSQHVFPAVILSALGGHLPDVVGWRTAEGKPQRASRVERETEGSASRQGELEEREGILLG